MPKASPKVRPVGHSRITRKGQATIPLSVRERLHLKAGDSVLFEEWSNGRTVSIRRAEPLDLEFLRSIEQTLDEWNSANDDEAYGDL